MENIPVIQQRPRPAVSGSAPPAPPPTSGRLFQGAWERGPALCRLSLSVTLWGFTRVKRVSGCSEPTGQTAAGCASHRETSERCPFGAVTGRASLTMHVIFCGLVPLFLLGKYRRAESLGFCMVCSTINNQPDCFPVLHSSPAGHRHSTLPSPCTLLASIRRSLFILLTLGSTKRHLIVVFVCVS